LKDSYFKQAGINLEHAEERYKNKIIQGSLFEEDNSFIL
jgi:hypothetical protein